MKIIKLPVLLLCTVLALASTVVAYAAITILLLFVLCMDGDPKGSVYSSVSFSKNYVYFKTVFRDCAAWLKKELT